MSSSVGSHPHRPLAALVGLCPLLMLAPDAARSLALGVAIVLMTLLSLPWWALQRHAPPAARWPTTLLVLAAAAGATQLLLDASSHGLHPLTALGVPLVAANLALWSPQTSIGGGSLEGALATLRRALGAAAALLLLGVLRELFAEGTVFASSMEYLGQTIPLPVWRWSGSRHGLLLFAQPAGALFALACLLAALQAWRTRRTPSTTGHA